jgi:cytochrome c oxidase cbb3-type subunit 1
MSNMNYTVETLALAVGAFLALLGVAFAHDSLFAAHMWVLFFALFAGTVVMVRRANFAPITAAQKAARQSEYLDEVVKYGVIATMFWGVVGFLVGVIVALQLAFPDLNIEPWLNFGRTRPLHTSAVIFAFGGNALIATSFYVVQRTSRARFSAATSPGSSSGATSSSSSWPRPAICSASPRARNTPSRNGMSTSG